jgi:hypothetical protein
MPDSFTGYHEFACDDEEVSEELRFALSIPIILSE